MTCASPPAKTPSRTTVVHSCGLRAGGGPPARRRATWLDAERGRCRRIDICSATILNWALPRGRSCITGPITRFRQAFSCSGAIRWAPKGALWRSCRQPEDADESARCSRPLSEGVATSGSHPPPTAGTRATAAVDTFPSHNSADEVPCEPAVNFDQMSARTSSRAPAAGPRLEARPARGARPGHDDVASRARPDRFALTVGREALNATTASRAPVSPASYRAARPRSSRLCDTLRLDWAPTRRCCSRFPPNRLSPRANRKTGACNGCSHRFRDPIFTKRDGALCAVAKWVVDSARAGVGDEVTELVVGETRGLGTACAKFNVSCGRGALLAGGATCLL